MIVRCGSAAKMVPLKDLRPHPKNRNKHPDDQIARLADILEYQGWRYPIKVSNRSGFVTAGHGRIEAAKLKGWKEVPVSFQDYDSDEQEYADVQADNAIASWAELDLSGINSDIGDIGPDFNIDLLGIEGFVLEPAELIPQCDEDEVPEHVEPRTKLGDIYQLGSHRLMCGDSTSIDAVERLMAGSRATICFTSPPYNAGDVGALSNSAEKGAGKYLGSVDSREDSEYVDLLCGFLSAAMTISDYQFVNLQMLAGNKLALVDWLGRFKNHVADVAIWDKQHGQPAMAECVMNSQFEFVFIFGSSEHPSRAISTSTFRGTVSNVYAAPPKKANEYHANHAATFPEHLPEHFIASFSAPCDGIYEPFGGTGTTVIACEKTNRRCFMMELDPKYCDVIVARWEKFTGKKAELIDG